ncbi:MAG TPA: RNA polymerase sigma factor [Gemmatimonadaceae bacterium]|jgi:RNA polymerase sigma-70 factor (ECF subfamily)|nr:RNA polymerase sigma factor [Gemmatimonadaceae bacterium]
MTLPVRAEPDDDRARDADDAALVARVWEGDATAFDAIVARHFPVMVRYAAALVGAPDDAEDVAQGVLARVWRYRESWRVTTTVRTYLLSAVRNEAANRRRTLRADARREATMLHEAAIGSAVWGGEGADNRVADRAEVAALLATLAPRRREAIVLRYGMGLTYPEIGQVMGLTRKAAEQLVLRALLTLRNRVGGR